MNRLYLVSGVMLIAISAALVAGKLLAFDAIQAFVVSILSPDQIVSEDGEESLVRHWYSLIVICLLLGSLLCVCSKEKVRKALARWVGNDILADSYAGVPRPKSVLWWSLCCGLTIVILFIIHKHLGFRMPLLFKKEGILESLTFILYLLSAVGCFFVALRVRSNSSVLYRRSAGFFFLVCALVFFLIAGEEVSWGQRVFDIKTPEALVTLNHQSETNVHNLLTKDALDATTKAVVVIFLIGLIVMWALVAVLRMPVLHFVAPHPSLVGLGLLTFYSGLMFHLEIFEVLLAIFVAFYSFRVFKAAMQLNSNAGFLGIPASERNHSVI